MTDVTVPELAESISEASIDTWHVAVGDAVTTGQNLVSIETDKVMLDVPAQEDGVIKEILKQPGDDVASGEVIGRIEAGAVASAEVPKAEGMASATEAADGADGVKVSSPAVRKIATEEGVDLSAVTGTGKDGRITKADVLDAAKNKQGAAAAPAPAAAKPAPQAAVPAVPVGSRNERRERMSKLRSKVAERLLQSQQQAAILTTFNEVDMTEVIRLRSRYRDEFEKKHGIKLGFMSFFVKAATAALRQYPIVNAGIDGDEIVNHDYCDIGIAVGSPRGLVVPVLRNAEAMGMAQIEASIADFGKRAQDGSLGIDELSGGTFTITNGGVFGSMLSTPIINPPQSAILGVHKTSERPHVVDGEIKIRPINYIALSYDHRLIDGRDAVLFLVAIKNNLEQPARLVLEV